MLENKDWLEKNYSERSAKEIADSLGVTTRTVHNWMKRHGIPRTGNDQRLPDSFLEIAKDRSTLQSEYETHGVMGLCSIHGVSRTAVYNALEKFNIPRLSGLTEDSHKVLNSKDDLVSLYTKYGVNGAAEYLGVNNTTISNYLTSHGVSERIYSDSFFETEFKDFLTSVGVRFESRRRDILDGMEIDVFLPSHNVGFELNGLYWHSSKFINKNKHLEKTEKAACKGISLYHVFEDDWKLRKTQWKNKILSILGMDRRTPIGARETTFEIVSSTYLKAFFDKNHIQGFSGGSVACCLKFNDSVVAAAIFKADPSKTNSIVLNRYATSTRVVGGLGKLLKNIKPTLRSNGYSEIVSFADRTISDGRLYEATGWKLVDTLPPDYKYHYKGIRVRKQNFRRKKLEAMLGDKFDPNESELKNTHRNGIYRIYDCGLLKYSISL